LHNQKGVRETGATFREISQGFFPARWGVQEGREKMSALAIGLQVKEDKKLKGSDSLQKITRE